jgi:SAM-dependent methyltransferase
MFRRCSDEYWFWLLTFSPRLGIDTNGIIPGLPPEYMQENWTGMTGERTMRQAFHFYKTVHEMARRYSRPIGAMTSILDFGCGWGRIIRFFLRDVDHENLVGADCYPEALEAASAQNHWCQFVRNSPFPPLDLHASSFDVIYLFSVFSHLSEVAHLAWLAEFNRLLKPGGLLVATTRPRDHFALCAHLRAVAASGDHYRGLASCFTETEQWQARYDRGEYCYHPLGGGGVLEPSFFGETCIPRQYVDRSWTEWFNIGEYRLADDISLQNIICCTKK